MNRVSLPLTALVAALGLFLSLFVALPATAQSSSDPGGWVGPFEKDVDLGPGTMGLGNNYIESHSVSAVHRGPEQWDLPYGINPDDHDAAIYWLTVEPGKDTPIRSVKLVDGAFDGQVLGYGSLSSSAVDPVTGDAVFCMTTEYDPHTPSELPAWVNELYKPRTVHFRTRTGADGSWSGWRTVQMPTDALRLIGLDCAVGDGQVGIVQGSAELVGDDYGSHHANATTWFASGPVTGGADLDATLIHSGAHPSINGSGPGSWNLLWLDWFGSPGSNWVDMRVELARIGNNWAVASDSEVVHNVPCVGCDPEVYTEHRTFRVDDGAGILQTWTRPGDGISSNTNYIFPGRADSLAVVGTRIIVPSESRIVAHEANGSTTELFARAPDPDALTTQTTTYLGGTPQIAWYAHTSPYLPAEERTVLVRVTPTESSVVASPGDVDFDDLAYNPDAVVPLDSHQSSVADDGSLWATWSCGWGVADFCKIRYDAQGNQVGLVEAGFGTPLPWSITDAELIFITGSAPPLFSHFDSDAPVLGAITSSWQRSDGTIEWLEDVAFAIEVEAEDPAGNFMNFRWLVNDSEIVSFGSWEAPTHSHIAYEFPGPGEYTFAVQARDAAGNLSAVQTQTITVVPQGTPVAGSAVTNLNITTAGSPNNYTITATWDPTAFAVNGYSVGLLIDGFTVDSQTVSGTSVTFTYNGTGSQAGIEVYGLDAGYGLGELTTATKALPAGSGGPVTPPTFSDVPAGHQFGTQISWMVSQGITTGYANGTFRPKGHLERQAFAAFLYRYDGAAGFTPPVSPTFSDVPIGHQFYTQIEWAVAEGITTGYADGTFRPKGTIDRDATVTFLWRYAGRPTPSGSPGFSDVPPNHQFATSIAWAVQEGITTGYANGTFRPKNKVERQAVAAFLYRFDGN